MESSTDKMKAVRFSGKDWDPDLGISLFLSFLNSSTTPSFSVPLAHPDYHNSNVTSGPKL